MIDDSHREAITDSFASELLTSMSNNIADYLFQDLLSEKYEDVVLATKTARTVPQIRTYVT